ncbi:MAG: bifunctional DNA primase/polymerase [Cyanobacteria bacterium J06592_8]
MIASYSPNKGIQETLEALLALGYPPLPVAPKQDARKSWVQWNSRTIYAHHVHRVREWHHPNQPKTVIVDSERVQASGEFCRISHTKIQGVDASVRGDYVRLDEHLQPIPRFTGKNPSYLDKNGIPRILHHGEYQNRLPSPQELKKWFAHPNNGIGTLGGHGGVVWIDFDAKNYPTQEDCDRAVQGIRDKLPGTTWVEQTGSGGYRIALKPKQTPTFTNFATTSGGQHVGEALNDGRFTVLAPSIHPNGNSYQRLEWSNPVEIESLLAVGIYPAKDEVATLERKSKREAKTHTQVQETFNTPTNPQDNPWDIRNFATFFEGYTEKSNGWGYAKCPHHNGTSLTSFRVNLYTGEYKLWCGCDTKQVYQSGLQLALSCGYKLSETQEPNPVEYQAYQQQLQQLETPVEVERDRQHQLWEEQRDVIAQKSWRKAKQFTPTITQQQQYVDFSIPPIGSSLVVKSGLGTGKTETLKRQIMPSLLANNEGLIVIGSRNSLLIQTCDRLAIKHLHKHQAFDQLSDPKGRIALCTNSLHYFLDRRWFIGKTVILDEFMSTIKHLLLSKTHRKNRKEYIDLFVSCLTSASRRIFLDGHSADWAIDYLKRFLGEGHPFIQLENLHKPSRPTVEFLTGACVPAQHFNGDFKNPDFVVMKIDTELGNDWNINSQSPASPHSAFVEAPIYGDFNWLSDKAKVNINDYSQLTEAIFSSSKFGVISDSQRELEALEKTLQSLGLQGLRVDSKTIAEEYHPARSFLENSDRWIFNNQPDYLLISPTFAEGGDISIRGYFKDLFALFHGVLGVDALRQFLGRFRDPAIRFHVWCKEYGLKSSIFNSYFAQTVTRQLEDFLRQDAESIAEGKAEFLQAFSQSIDGLTDDPHYQAWGQLQSIENYEKSHLRDCLKQMLISDGYQVKEVILETDIEAKTQLKQAKQQVDLQTAADIFFAVDISTEEAEELAAQWACTWADRCAIRHRAILDRLPGIEKTVFWCVDFVLEMFVKNRRLVTAMETYYLLNNPEDARDKQRNLWAGLALGGERFLADVRSQHQTIEALRYLNIPQSDR